jgi:hypothetical protein
MFTLSFTFFNNALKIGFIFRNFRFMGMFLDQKTTFTNKEILTDLFKNEVKTIFQLVACN